MAGPGSTKGFPAVDTVEKLWGGYDFSRVYGIIGDFTSPNVGTYVGDKREDGTYEVPSLREHLSTRAKMAVHKKVACYVDRYLVPFFDSFEKGDNYRNRLVELSSDLSTAVLPGFLSVDAAAQHACFATWFYVIDDACVDLVETMTNYQWATHEWYRDYIEQIMCYCELCLDAACNLRACPEPPTQDQLFNTALLREPAPAEIKNQLFDFTLFGPALHAVIELIVQLVGVDNISRIKKHVENLCNGKKEEVLTAPTAIDEYYERHRKTGGVGPCIEIALAVSLHETGLDPGILFKLECLENANNYLECANGSVAVPFGAAFYHCDLSVLSANDAQFVKDIGRAEEALMAVKIYQELSSKGISVDGLDLSTAEGHGHILSAYANSDHAFNSLKEILQDAQNHMILMAKSCEELVNVADDTNDVDAMAGARIATRVFLRWSLGYYLYNPYSKRYSSSFGAIKAVLQDKKTDYKANINAHLDLII